MKPPFVPELTDETDRKYFHQFRKQQRIMRQMSPTKELVVEKIAGAVQKGAAGAKANVGGEFRI